MGSDPGNPLSPTLDDFQYDLAINTVSAYAAAQATVTSFEKLAGDARKTFIYTGNAGNTVVSLSRLLTVESQHEETRAYAHAPSRSYPRSMN